jgi:hypothetical protein
MAMRRIVPLLWFLSVALPAAAQEVLDPLWRLPFDASGVSDIQAQSFQLYRIPIGFTVREADERVWGVEITLPVSLGGHEVSAATGVGDLVRRVGTYTVVPGVELHVPVGQHWMIKPFGEVGLTGSTAGGGADALYGVGVRTRAGYDAGRVGLTLGGALEYKSGGDSRSLVRYFSTAAVAADAQLPVSLRIGGRAAHAGIFSIVRVFSDVKLRTIGRAPISINRQVEAGLSFATDPPLKIWKVKLPWIGLAYRDGGALSGVVVYFAFPF